MLLWFWRNFDESPCQSDADQLVSHDHRVAEGVWIGGQEGAARLYGTRVRAREWRVLLLDLNFPAEHWKHLRTLNPIESTFATVRHRTTRSKACLSNKIALAMVFKLGEGAQKILAPP